MQSGDPCYLLTSAGAYMPGIFVGISRTDDDRECYDIAAPGGRIYSCRPEAVYDAETGRAMLAYRRAQQLSQEGYLVQPLPAGAYRVYSPAKHGPDGGYIIVRSYAGEMRCNCPAREKSGLTCKHELALEHLLAHQLTTLAA